RLRPHPATGVRDAQRCGSKRSPRDSPTHHSPASSSQAATSLKPSPSKSPSTRSPHPVAGVKTAQRRTSNSSPRDRPTQKEPFRVSKIDRSSSPLPSKSEREPG